MLKEYQSRDFSEHTMPIINDYMALVFFLSRQELVPDSKDLLQFIHDNHRDWAFIDYLLDNINRLINQKGYADDLQTDLALHIQNMRDRNIPLKY